jgi:NAD(P)-dependent dehydrogenase (short-subunit alcohol dehydrogenase family)
MSAGDGSFDGKAVVITGAGGGIGRALARRFAGAGASVALLDVDAVAVRSAVDQLSAAGADTLALQCDVSSPKACVAAVQAAVDRWGGIDVLVNNAGITHLGPFASTELAVFRRVFDVNVFGAIYCTQAALPSLLERRGAVVTVSSVAGFAPLYGRSGYSASKHALHGLFETLRCELADAGVHVMMVCPGFTDTAIESHALGGGARATVGRLASPDAVASAVVAGLAKQRRLLVLSRVGKMSWLLSRLAPSLYERQMTRRMKGNGG